MGDLDGRVAVVTGAGQGLGAGIARTFAGAGARVAVLDVNPVLAAEIAASLRADGVDCLSLPTDVTNPLSVEAAMARVVECWGAIDVLVNNAGIVVRKPFEEITPDEWNRVMQVNVNGVFLCSQAAGRRMLTRRKGRIINISSVFAFRGFADSVVYCASKAAVVGMTVALANAWAQWGVTVNAVAPAYIDSPLNEYRKVDPKLEAETLSHIPMGRWGQIRDVAEACLFLASDRASWVTGHTLVVDGGYLTV